MEIATLGCAVRVKLSQDKKRIEDVRLGYGVAGPTPLRCRKAEEGLKGHPVNDSEAVLAFGKAALEEVNPAPHGGVKGIPSAAHRRTVQNGALAEAIKKAGGAVNA